MRRLLGLAGMAKAGAAKADPALYAVMIAAFGAAAAPGSVLDNFALGFWLFVGSMCGACFVLFGDEKKPLTKRAIMGKLSVCFVPGFCFTGFGIKALAATWPDKSWAQPSAELVLAASLILSVGGPMIVAKLVKKTGDKIDGGGV